MLAIIRVFWPFVSSAIWWMVDRLYGDDIFRWLRPMIPELVSSPTLDHAITFGPIAVMLGLGLILVWHHYRRQKGTDSTTSDAVIAASHLHPGSTSKIVNLRSSRDILFDCKKGKEFFADVSQNCHYFLTPRNPEEGVYILHLRWSVDYAGIGHFDLGYMGVENIPFVARKGTVVTLEVRILEDGDSFLYLVRRIFESGVEVLSHDIVSRFYRSDVEPRAVSKSPPSFNKKSAFAVSFETPWFSTDEAKSMQQATGMRFDFESEIGPGDGDAVFEIVSNSHSSGVQTNKNRITVGVRRGRVCINDDNYGYHISEHDLRTRFSVRRLSNESRDTYTGSLTLKSVTLDKVNRFPI